MEALIDSFPFNYTRFCGRTLEKEMDTSKYFILDTIFKPGTGYLYMGQS